MCVAGAAGLEFGAARFFHLPWPANGLLGAQWLRVFEPVYRNSLPNPTGSDADAQLASLFIRWAPPASGFEAYGEYGREDHNADSRDLAKEPDHDASYLVGVQRVFFNPRRQSMTVVRAELLNTRISHLQQAAQQTAWYLSGGGKDHTERGQVLGSAGAYGGGASTFALDRYTSSGRTTIRWDRLMLGEFLNASDLPHADRADVLHAINLERMLRAGGLEVTGSATLAKEFNRHFGADAYNVNVSASVRKVRP